MFDDFMSDDDYDQKLRTPSANPASNSTLSDLDCHDNYGQSSQFLTQEHCRMVPQRLPQSQQVDQAFSFERKELLFNQKRFNCAHLAGETCDCAKLE